MYITRLKLKNWRNFLDVDIPLSEYNYFLGHNASGKSNLLDVFRFLRDISKPQGGGLQKAINDRGGLSKIRCLHARHQTDVFIEIHLSESFSEEDPLWKYILSFNHEGKGNHRVLISKEEVWKRGVKNALLIRPNQDDNSDISQKTETHLEQTRANKEFRDISNFLSNVLYLHLVPQLLKYNDIIGGNRLEDDPFGQGFLERIASTTERIRASRLLKITSVLSNIIPSFSELKYVTDNTGRPHLEARYKHHRPNAGLQREDQFSDGTLRLIALLWSLLDTNSLLLLEEPELSLNEEIVQRIPEMIESINKKSKKKRQLIITTHSAALLSNKGIDGRGVMVLEPAKEGSQIRPLSENEQLDINDGLSIAEVMLPKTSSGNLDLFYDGI
jgi:predicted ATPase